MRLEPLDWLIVLASLLVCFYRKVRPFGPGWRRVREAAGISAEEAARATTAENIPLCLLGWVAGCCMVWSALFALGNLLYGRMLYAWVLAGVFLGSAWLVFLVINRLWRAEASSEKRSDPEVSRPAGRG